MTTTTPTIATTAPSGNVGRHVVADLVRAVRPRVLGHRTASVTEDLREHVDTVVTDLADPAPVERALTGIEALFVTVPAPASTDPLADYDTFATSVAGGVERGGPGGAAEQRGG